MAPKSRTVPRPQSTASMPGEAFARRALEANNYTHKCLEEALALADVPVSSNRKNVIPDGVPAVQGAVCGLYAFAGKVGVTYFTKRRPWLSRLLCRYCKHHRPDFKFTSVQVNVNYAARPHTDKNNLGTSLIVGLGNYSGGELWVHDDQGTVPLVLDEGLFHEPLYSQGETIMGRHVDVKCKWFEFDGNRLHCTKPFQGTRFSLVYFTFDLYAQASMAVRADLRKVGFVFRWNSISLQRKLTSKKEQRIQLVKTKQREKNGMHKGIVSELIDDDELEYQQDNPKVPDTTAYTLYESYKTAKTKGEAKALGSRGIDFVYDYNMGFMKVVALHAEDPRWDAEVPQAALPSGADASRGRSRSSTCSALSVAKRQRRIWIPGVLQGRTLDAIPKERGYLAGWHPVVRRLRVKVRVREMSAKHKGFDVPHEAMTQLTTLMPSLSGTTEDRWAAPDGPFATARLSTLRVLLGWVATGRLRYESSCREELVNVFLELGEEQLARAIGREEKMERKVKKEGQSSQAAKKERAGKAVKKEGVKKESGRSVKKEDPGTQGVKKEQGPRGEKRKADSAKGKWDRG